MSDAFNDWLSKQLAKAQAESKRGGGEHHFVFGGMGIDLRNGHLASFYQCECGAMFAAGPHRSLTFDDFIGRPK